MVITSPIDIIRVIGENRKRGSFQIDTYCLDGEYAYAAFSHEMAKLFLVNSPFALSIPIHIIQKWVVDTFFISHIYSPFIIDDITFLP